MSSLAYDVTGSLHPKQLLIKLTWLFYLGCFFTSRQVLAEQLFHFNIISQPADQALIAFAKKTDKTIIFSYEMTKNYQANSLSGYFSVEHGLAKLLRDTGLEGIVTDDKKIRIQQQINDPRQANHTPINPNKIEPPVASTSPRAKVEKIAIVGSRDIARSIRELPVPVDILSDRLLANTGQLENGRMLQTVAPSFNFASSSISDGTDVLKPATLRGLGPDQTLILVNGKRRHHASLVHINTSVGRGTSGVGINSIPFSAIKRIEILRDGAAAQYGSDAIAGVVNIVLKDSASAGRLNASAGQYTQGDGQSLDFSINKGIELSNQGFLNTTFSFQDHQSTDRSGLHGSCQYTGCTLLADGRYVTSNPREISANRHTFTIGDPAYQQLALAYNAQYPLASGQLYSFATYSKRENDAPAFFRDNLYQGANPRLQDGEALIPGGFLPSIHSDISDAALSIGYNIELTNDTALDLSYTFGRNKISYQTNNSVNASYAAMLQQQNQLTAQQIRTQIPRSAHAYDLSLSLQTLNLDVQQAYNKFTLALGIELRRDNYQVIAGNKYSYFDYSAELANPPNDILGGIQGFPGIAPNEQVNEDRDIASIYLELNHEVHEKININSAIRYDNYEGFGGTSNIKFAANWQLSEQVNLRSSISTGFRAPSMQQLYFNNTSTQFIVNNDNQLSAQQVGTFRNDSQFARAIGIPKLKEEQSTNFAFGTVIDFTPQLTLTLDYYAIDIDDRIVISNKLSPEDSPILAQAITNADVNKAQVFLNGANTQTRGIDIISTWQHRLYHGRHSLTLAANVTKTEVSKLYSPENSALHQLTVGQVFAEQDISIIEQWQPQDRISLTSFYQQDNWSLNLAFNRYGKYTISDGEKQTYGAKTLTDIRFEQSPTDSFSWYAGVNNLFDVTPDKNAIGNSHAGTIIDQHGNEVVSSAGVFKYSRRSAPFGFNGSYLYLGINYHF